MGWASYFEDNYERLMEALGGLRKIAHESSAADARIREEALRALQLCDQFFSQLWGLADLATDPKLDLAGELASARSDARQAGHARNAAEALAMELERELVSARSSIERLNREIQSLNDRYRNLQQEHERLIESNMSAAINAFPPKRAR